MPRFNFVRRRPNKGQRPDVAPGAGWAGTRTTAGAPADQNPAIRTNLNYAKPGLRILTEPGDMVVGTDDLIIGVHAYAGNASGPLPVTVKLWIEGATYDIPFGTHSYIDANGNPRTLWGYFARLKHSLFAQDGGFNVFWEATVPADPSYQNRVIGPFRYTRLSGFGTHDFEAQVAADGRPGTFTTLAAAMNDLRSKNAQNPRITIVQSGLYALSGSTTYGGGAGYLTITHAPGVVARLNLPNSSRPQWNGIRLRGNGIKWDYADPGTVLGIVGAGSTSGTDVYSQGNTIWKSFILDGCHVLCSTGLTSPEALAASNTKLINNSFQFCPHGSVAYLDDTLMENVIMAYENVAQHALARNARCLNVAGADALKAETMNVYGFDADGVDIEPFVNEPLNLAFTLTYTGAAATATWRTTHAVGSSSNTMVLAENGTDLPAITLAGKKASQVVAEINARTGWQATWNKDRFDAVFMTEGYNTAKQGLVTTAQNVKNVTDSVYFLYGMHGDLLQTGISGTRENSLIVNFKAYRIGHVQQMFFSGATNNDFFCINWAVGGSAWDLLGTDLLSQLSNFFRNGHWWHVTHADQQLTMRGSGLDSYCSFRGSIFHRLMRDGTSNAFTAGAFADNAIQTPGSGNGLITQVNQRNVGLTIAQMITDQYNGDFTPLPAVASIPSLVPFDVNNNPRGAVSRIGAVA